MKTAAAVAGLSLGMLAANLAAQDRNSIPSVRPIQQNALARDLLRELVAIETTPTHGSTDAAEAMAARLRAGGFDSSDVLLAGPRPDRQNLVVRLRGRVVSLGGEAVAEGVRAGPAQALAEAEELGAGLADELLGEGADAILRSVREAGAEPVPEP